MSERGLDWYKRDPIRFLDAVQGMGPELIGAYAVLLDLVYARGGKSKRDDRHLAGVLGCSKRKAKALTDALIEARKITVADDYLTNKRAETTVKQRRTDRETLANRGRMGAEKRWQSNKNNNIAMATATTPKMAEKRREDTLPNGSGAATAPKDAKDILFSDVLEWLGRVHSKPPNSFRSLIGKWLQLAGNDAAAVLDVCRQAQADRVADPLTWISAHFQPKRSRSSVQTLDEILETAGIGGTA